MGNYLLIKEEENIYSVCNYNKGLISQILFQ